MIRNFEELREHILEEKHDAMERLYNHLEESTPFELGRYQGEIMAFDAMIGTLRNILKYGVEA